MGKTVEDHFAILKVGPASTFALGEALFALAAIEGESMGSSTLLEVLESALLLDDTHWRKYYHGSPLQQITKPRYSHSDRVRDYCVRPEIDAAVQAILQRLGQNPLPLTLLSQYLPAQYWKVRQGCLDNNPVDMIYDRITETIVAYPFEIGWDLPC